MHPIKFGNETPEVPSGEGPTASPFAPAPLTVETVDNHIHFYSSVNSDRCLALMRTIRETDNRLRNEYISRDLPSDYPMTPIWLHISSFGGGVLSAFNVADQLKTIKTPIYSVIDGYCASAATLISMACTKRFVRPLSFMLVHQIWSVMWGTYEQFKDEMAFQNMIMEKLIGFYKDHSKLNKTDIKELLKNDRWFDADQCIASGLADEIYKE